MKKCVTCAIGSWIVGLSTLWLAGMGLGGWALPAGGAINVAYAVLGLVALTFLYYQIVPCKRCAAVNKPKTAVDAAESAAGEMEE